MTQSAGGNKKNSRAATIAALLNRGVEEVIDKDHLRAALLSQKKLRVKLGIDPTSPDLHLGHSVVLRKLREFQDLGHKAVLIIGDFTGRIGDPSGRAEARKPLTAKQIKENMRAYLAQAGKIINVKKAEIFYNNSWFGKMNAADFMTLAAAGSIQQVLRRADFKQRLDDSRDITLLEILYPLFQGYDSVKIRADVELGGMDQKFNLLMGRRVQRNFNQAEQDALTVPLLEGTDGVKKMSKSVGNYIGLNDSPRDMFGKIMAIPDKLISRYFLLCTNLETREIARLEKELPPRDQKLELGMAIVALYYGTREAVETKTEWQKLFSQKQTPDNLPYLKFKPKALTAAEAVFVSGAVKSRGEAWRLVAQGGLEIDGKTVREPRRELIFFGGEVLKIGKRRFFRAKV